MRKALTVLVWVVALFAVAFNGVELADQFWNMADSAPQQAAIAAYRTGMMVLFYAIGRGLTDTIKVAVPKDA
jgi:hypothetical protein